jgi:acyl-CoA hydrolase
MVTFVEPQEAAAAIRPTDQLGIPLGPGHPNAVLHALGERQDWEDLLVSGALLTDLYTLFTLPGVRFLSGFFGPVERGYRDAGMAIEFVPADFRRFKPILEDLSPRVMATAASMPDADGFMSLSLHAGATVASLHDAGADPDRLLIVECSPNFPRTFGLGDDSHRLHLDECDILVRSEARPFEIGEPPPTERDLAIARFALEFIQSGCTLQTGIGSIPSTIATLLAESEHGDFGIHSEMFTNGLMRLHKAGKVTNRHKGIFPDHSITTFAGGTRELYDWLDGNEAVRFLPVAKVNSPEVIADNVEMVTINGAIAVDLFGQVVADTIGGRQFSGIGGHEDFIAGAGLEFSDRSLICLPATVETADGLVSRIVPGLAAGSVVTTPRHQVDVIVTEFGAAELRGRTVRERAEALASIAHPQFSDELLAAAAALG